MFKKANNSVNSYNIRIQSRPVLQMRCTQIHSRCINDQRRNTFAIISDILFYILQVQRYEGASTIYGRHTLTIYLSQYRKLAEALVKASNMYQIIVIIIFNIIIIILSYYVTMIETVPFIWQIVLLDFVHRLNYNIIKLQLFWRWILLPSSGKNG
jgi:hypothetical protein